MNLAPMPSTNTQLLMMLVATASIVPGACTGDDSNDGVASSDAGDGDGDSTADDTAGDGDDESFRLACKAFGDLVRMCHGTDDGDQSEADCLEYLEYYASEVACLEAVEAHMVCLSALSCDEFEGPACGEDEDRVDATCPD